MSPSPWATRVLPLAALVLALGSCQRATPPPPPPANVLFLVVDCLRADRAGAATAYHREVAPAIESLAAEGTRFTSAFAQTSWTRPSIPTMLTGLYPSEHGLGAFSSDGENVTGASLSPQAVTVAEALRALGYTTALFGQQNQLAPRFGLDQGFDVYDHKASRAERIHNRLLGWLDSEPRRPFFAYLHYLELHWPYCAPPETRGLFTAGYQGRPLCADWRRLRDEIRSGAVILTAEEKAAMQGQYDEQLVALDRHLGQLFAALRERDLWDDTLVILTSDHGEEFFEHGGMAHGTTLYDELIHVPLVLKPPKSWEPLSDHTVTALVEHRDLLPTLLEAAGATAAETEGRLSLRPWTRGEEGTRREFVVSELGEQVAVRTEDHKLVIEPGGPARLYDLESDPAETVDVAADQPEALARLEAYARRWKASLRPIEAGDETLDDETVEGLRNLGYIE